MSFDSIRKKQRGLRRHSKKINGWKEANLHLNEEQLNKYHFDYVKCTIDPFYRKFNVSKHEYGFRNPPNWIKRMFFDGLLEILRTWSKEVKSLHEESYLKVWVFEKTFVESQVVVGIETRMNWYNTLFDECVTHKKFPYQQFGYSEETLSDIVWKQYHSYERVFHKELLDDMEYLKYIAGKACKVEEDEKLGKVYLLDEGVVWVGEVIE